MILLAGTWLPCVCKALLELCDQHLEDAVAAGSQSVGRVLSCASQQTSTMRTLKRFCLQALGSVTNHWRIGVAAGSRIVGGVMTYASQQPST